MRNPQFCVSGKRPISMHTRIVPWEQPLPKLKYSQCNKTCLSIGSLITYAQFKPAGLNILSGYLWDNRYADGSLRNCLDPSNVAFKVIAEKQSKHEAHFFTYWDFVRAYTHKCVQHMPQYDSVNVHSSIHPFYRLYYNVSIYGTYF